jgi:hypothetical protein
MYLDGERERGSKGLLLYVVIPQSLINAHILEANYVRKAMAA